MPKEPLITKSLRLSETLWAEIEQYRARVRALSLAEAVRRLIEAGLKAERERKDG
jgi:hypothetical protein